MLTIKPLFINYLLFSNLSFNGISVIPEALTSLKNLKTLYEKNFYKYIIENNLLLYI